MMMAIVYMLPFTPGGTWTHHLLSLKELYPLTYFVIKLRAESAGWA
jgi:hypothetical protein